MFKTLIVSEHPLQISGENINTITFRQYLEEYPKAGEPKTRVLNLCDLKVYLSTGYYCSLLAEARHHTVMPSAKTIHDLQQAAGLTEIASEPLALPKNLAEQMNGMPTDAFYCYFGWVENTRLQKLAKWVYEKYQAPILSLRIESSEQGYFLHLAPASINDLGEHEKSRLQERLHMFTTQVWKSTTKKKRERWDLAILHNPNEATPPSDTKALNRFVKAATQVGINAELIEPHQLSQISHFDALFIRETTALHHHTYRAAKLAEREGLVVIDDADSILRCCNKVFLQDAFTYHKVPAPYSGFVTENTAQTRLKLIEEYGLPMVLKLPESSFSLGVFKVKTEAELQDKLALMLEKSAIVLVQRYIYTDYDWRIGVLNGRAIYACRYHMARGHWQIYNHDSKKDHSGGFDTLPTFEVPRPVLNAAVKASKIIGRGLYGVDIKYVDNKVYVIEVNDNPSIESGVEDQYLGKELYMIIMQEFATRLENRGK